MKKRNNPSINYKGMLFILILLLISSSSVACAPKKDNPPKKEIQKKETVKKESSKKNTPAKKDTPSKKESIKKETVKKESTKKDITKKHTSNSDAKNTMDIVIALEKSNPFYQGFHGMSLSQSRALSPEEIKKINLCFEPLIPDNRKTGKDAYKVNPLSHFLTSEYEDVRQLDFDAFILYFESNALTENNPEDVEQFKRLQEISEFPFKELKKISEVPVPIHRKTRESLDEVLSEYGAIKVEDLEMPYQTVYLEEYDSFYTYESDFGAGTFTCTSATIEGSRIILKNEHQILTLLYRDGKLLIESFMRL